MQHRLSPATWVLLALVGIAALVAMFVDPATGLMLAGAGAVDPEKIETELKRIGDEVKSFAETAQKEIKAHAKLSEETRSNVDKLLTQQGELQARLQAAEQVVAKLETAGTGQPAQPKSLGTIVVESDEFKAANINGRGTLFSVQAALTNDGAASNGDIAAPQRLDGLQPGARRRLTIRDLLSWGRATSNSLEYVRETGFTNSANVVSENPAAGKPESDLSFELVSAPVATVAHHISASKQVLADVAQLRSYIDGVLRYGLKLKEEAQLLLGSGVGLNISGLYTQATAYANPGVNVQVETQIDRLRLAMLQVALAEYDADGIVLNPIDWAAIELTKTTDNAYLFSSPQGIATPMLWRRPVVATASMGSGDFLVGAFQMGAMGWDREDVTVTASTEHNTNFTKNLVTILCEERVALTVFRPESFIKGDFDGLPSSS